MSRSPDDCERGFGRCIGYDSDFKDVCVQYVPYTRASSTATASLASFSADGRVGGRRRVLEASTSFVELRKMLQSFAARLNEIPRRI